MKRMIKLTACCIGVFAFVACGGSSNSLGITVVGSDNTTYESYEEACHAQDYEAAHKFLTAMKKAGSSDYDEAREYVFNQEALFLIAMNDETSTKRLFFLLQEDANEVGNSMRDSRCNTIIELAIKQDNTALVEQTIGQYSGRIDKSVLQKIYNYLYTEGKKNDIDFMVNLLKKNGGIDIMVSDAIKRHDNPVLIQILEKNGCEYDLESMDKIVKYIVGQNDKQLTSSCLSLLSENNQWDAMLYFGIETGNLLTIKSAYQKNNDKDKAFETLATLLRSTSNTAIKQYIFTLATNKERAEKLIGICLKENNTDAINKLTQTFGSQFDESLLNEVLDYAITKSDMALIKKVYQNIDDKDAAFKKIVKVINSSTDNTFKQYLLSIATNEERAEELINVCLKNDHPDIILKLTKKFGSQFSERFLDDIMEYAISKDGSDFTNLVISILNSTKIEGRPLPAGQRMTSDRPADVVASHNQYVQSVKEFNSKCDEVLSSAISQHKSLLANKVVTLYKDVPNDYVVNEHWWQIAQTCTYSKDDKTRAQERVKEAKKRGDI